MRCQSTERFTDELLAYLEANLGDAREDANEDKDSVFGKVRAGEAIAYANVIQWVKTVGSNE